MYRLDEIREMRDSAILANGMNSFLADCTAECA